MRTARGGARPATALAVRLSLTMLMLAGCGGGGSVAGVSSTSGPARASSPRGPAVSDTIEYQGFRFPKAIGAYLLPSCQETGGAPLTPRDVSGPEMLNFTIVSYFESGVTRMAPVIGQFCETSDPHLALAVTVSVTGYSTPDVARAVFDRENVSGYVSHLGQSQCGVTEPAPFEGECGRVDGSTVFYARAAGDLSEAYDGYRIPTQAEVAQVLDAVVAAQH